MSSNTDFMQAKIIIHLLSPSGDVISPKEAKNIVLLLQSEDVANQQLGYTFLERLLVKFPAGKYELIFPKDNLNQVFEQLLDTNLHTLEIHEQPDLWPLPKAFGHMKMLKGVILRKMNIQELPATIYEFKDLEILDLADNYWANPGWYNDEKYHIKLDPRIAEFSELRKLDLSGNQLKLGDFPENLAQLTKLEHIGLSGNFLGKIPDFVYQYPRLKVLEMASTGLSSQRGKESLYSQFSRLVALKDLEKIDISVNYNGIDSIPSEWQQLTKLKHLQLNDNWLKELPEELMELPSLQHIALENNELKTLPESFGNLPLVDETLNLSNNELEYLPESICQWTHLKELDVSGNKLKMLPEELGNLVSVEELKLRQNLLTELPTSLEKLTKLKGKIVLTENKLTQLPPFLLKLPHITELELSNNKITDIPAEIKSLKRLRLLNLEQNKLTSLPESIVELTQLRTLRLARNKLKTLPEAITLLPIELLTLEKNKLEKLPEDFGNFKKIGTHLNLSYNKLTTLPESLSALTQLQELNLARNLLPHLPDFWDKFKRMYTLNLSYNQLKELPDSIGHMQSLGMEN